MNKVFSIPELIKYILSHLSIKSRITLQIISSHFLVYSQKELHDFQDIINMKIKLKKNKLEGYINSFIKFFKEGKLKILEQEFTLCHNNIQYSINWIQSSENCFCTDSEETYNTNLIEYIIIPAIPLYDVVIKENLIIDDYFDVKMYCLNVTQQLEYKNGIMPIRPFIENVRCVEYEIKFYDNDKHKHIKDYSSHRYKFIYLIRY